MPSRFPGRGARHNGTRGLVQPPIRATKLGEAVVRVAGVAGHDSVPFQPVSFLNPVSLMPSSIIGASSLSTLFARHGAPE